MNTTPIAGLPFVASDRNGNFVVAWTTQTGGQHVVTRRYDAHGVALTPEVRVDGTARSYANAADIAMNSAGDYVVVWQTSDGSNYEYRGRRFSPAGAPLGAEFVVVSAPSTMLGVTPRVAMDDAGNFTVGWSQNRVRWSDPTGFDIYRRRYGADGWPLEEPFRVNRTITGIERSFDLDMDAAGNAVFAWRSETGRYSGRAMAQRFSPSGAYLGSEFEVGSSAGGTYANATVSMARATGAFTVVWSYDTDANVYAWYRHYSASGAALTSATMFSGSYYTRFPAVASDADGDFALAWESDPVTPDRSDIYARRFAGSESVDMTVALVDAVDPVAVGETLQYTLSAANLHVATPRPGVGSATGVVVIASATAGSVPLSAVGEGWDCSLSADVRCSYRGSLAAATTSSPLSLVFSAPAEAGTAALSVHVSANSFDSVPGNNSATEETTIQ
ncbi:DUF11 domain-containing protein [Tahibacter amnicola]|uniref:DUF11 domain-containing protein n=1 Tax=Tahibacter amnicola TaxID=2976241 RepID=A0ABY6BKH2_9GAMM|nr:DUF11 domain-containing protein [Tahibacter amnicola]UXI70365.1 DUF11 domain-containing protein [Tahibacter amnicola]